MTYADALSALGDPTRRAIFDRLRSGPRAVGELASGFPISRPAVSQHLRVLKDAGLVRARRVGTRQVYEVEQAGLDDLRTYLEAFWDTALADFKAAAERRPRGGDMSSTETAIDPVVKTATLDCPIAHAFDVYTAGIARWWPLESHSIGERDAVSVVLEGRVDGRMYETDAAGTEHVWGRVSVWEPPHWLVIAWRVNPDAPAPTEIEVRFTALAADVTRIDLEHRGWERLGPERGAAARAEYGSDRGWTVVFGCYLAAIAGKRDGRRNPG
jgi:DNA-binding transcriptional ArsR family regulator/uncharacterized protein YndB with AHSA1/START domain